MAINLTAAPYNCVYGVGVSAAQKLANLVGYTAAVNACVSLGDFILMPEGAALELCAQPVLSANFGGTATAAAKVTELSGEVIVRCETDDPDDHPHIDYYQDFSLIEGGAVTPTKNRKRGYTPFSVLATNSGATFTIAYAGGGTDVVTLTDTSKDFVTAGLAAGMIIRIQNFSNPAEHNGTFTLTAVSTTQLQWRNFELEQAGRAAHGAITAGADDVYTAGPAHNNAVAHMHYSTSRNLRWLFEGVRYTGPDADQLWTGADNSFINHAPSGYAGADTHDVELINCIIDGAFTGTMFTTRGKAIYTLSSTTVKGISTVVSIHDDTGATASAGSTLRTDGGTIIDAQGWAYPAGVIDSGFTTTGSGLYLAPHVGVRVRNSVIKNCALTFSREYSSSRTVADYNNNNPIECEYTDTDFTQDSVAMTGSTVSPLGINTTDAAVTTTITRCRFLKGVATNSPTVMPRCTLTILEDCQWDAGGPLRAPDATSRRQTTVNVEMINPIVYETSAGATTISGFAGMNLDITGEDTDLTLGPAGNSNSILLSGPKAAEGEITVVAGSSLIDGETLTLTDPRPGGLTLVLEFDSNGSVAPGNVAIPFTGASTVTTIRNLVKDAINASALDIEASNGASNSINLAEGFTSVLHNLVITDTVAAAAVGSTIWRAGTYLVEDAHLESEVVAANTAKLVQISGVGGTMTMRRNALVGTSPVGGINFFADGTMDVVLEDNDLSGVANGRSIRFQETSNGNLPAGCVSGSGNILAHNGTAGGIIMDSPTPGAQNLEPPIGLDPTARTASSGTVKGSPNYSCWTVNGTVHSARHGTTAGAQNFTHIYAGARLSWVAGTSFVAQSGGNITWLSTGARAQGTVMHFLVSGDGLTLTETRVSVSVAATDAAADEDGDTGTFTLSRTGDPALALSVTVSLGGSATSDADYTEIPTTVNFAAGSATATVNVEALVDQVVAEELESVTMTVVAGADYDVSGGAATVYITDTTPLPDAWPSTRRARLQLTTPIATLELDTPTAGLSLGFPELNSPSWDAFALLDAEDLE